MKYKKGDKVIVVKLEKEHIPEVKIGDIHIVERICNLGEIMTKRNVFKSNEIELFDEKMKVGKTMKYKKGDKVKVRKDLKWGKYYNDLYFDKAMEKYKGKIYTIKNCYIDSNNYTLDCIPFWKFNDEMLELIEEKNKFKNGDKVRVIKNGKLGIINNLLDILPDYLEKGILNPNYRVEYIENNLGVYDYDYYSCLELKLDEKSEPILDEAEKKYLAGVIKPFKRYVDYIAKFICEENEEEYIRIKVRKNGKTELINLPFFKKDSMYKNMKIMKKYNLKELELL